MTSAIEIINTWADMAHEKHLTKHKNVFWIARDILEGKLTIPRIFCDNVIRYIAEEIKDSENKNIILEVLKEKIHEV